MAATLLEALNQQKQQAQQPQAPAPGTTDLTRKLLLTKSGKAGAAAGGGQPNISNLGEQAAIQQTKTDLSNVQQQGVIGQQQQAISAEGIEEAARSGRTALDQERQGNLLQIRMDTNRILREAEEGGRKLSLQQDKARLDQIAQGLRLQDEKYIDNLKRAGAQARLDNELDFEIQLQRAQLGDTEELLKKKLGNASILQAKERDLKRFIGTMDIVDAINIAKANGKKAAIQQKWQAIGSATEAGVGMMNTKGGDSAGYNNRAGAGAVDAASSGVVNRSSAYENQGGDFNSGGMGGMA